jgi:glucose-6-phosphate dehydrogenase assembly protein OpcA
MTAGARDRVDSVWSAAGTNPSEVEEAVRRLLLERYSERAGYVAARALNLVCVVDRRWAGEIANRMRGVGRYHASRTIVCAVEPGRRTIDARVVIASEAEPEIGEVALLRETIMLALGERHLRTLDSIVDPLVVSDVPTLLWAPHGHLDDVGAVLPLVQTVLLDSVDEPDVESALARARALLGMVGVVDLAWLRSTPWRERVAATFDPLPLRRELQTISAITVRHQSKSAMAALLLVAWMGSRLGWHLTPLLTRDGGRIGRAAGRRQDVRIALEPLREQQVRGLAGLTLETAWGRRLSLDRGAGGLRARYRNARGDERSWTILGASRGEGGILGEGIRQALIRDPTYEPALEGVARLVAAI